MLTTNSKCPNCASGILETINRENMLVCRGGCERVIKQPVLARVQVKCDEYADIMAEIMVGPTC